METGGAAASTTPMHSSVNWALLGLVIERPSYAYELARRFERTYEGLLALSSVSHVYMALASLRQRGLVEEDGQRAGGARSRRRYRATSHGVAEHARWLVSQLDDDRRRQRIVMVQLGALARTPARALETLDAYEQACLEEIRDAPSAGTGVDRGGTRLVARLVGEETRLTMAARLRWTQYARAQLLAFGAGVADADTDATSPSEHHAKHGGASRRVFSSG